MSILLKKQREGELIELITLHRDGVITEGEFIEELITNRGVANPTAHAYITINNTLKGKACT